MILAGLGLAAGLGSTITGAFKASKAAKLQKAELDGLKRDEQDWYARNYYSNYLDSTEAKAAIKRVEDTLNRRTQEQRARQVITGATAEQANAETATNNKALSDTVTGLASQGSAIKRSVDAQHQANLTNMANMRMGINAQEQAGGQNLIGGGAGLIGSALSLYEDKKTKV